MCAPAIYDTLATTIHPQSEWRRIAPIWRNLVAASRCSFFLTEAWVDTWLQTFGPALEVSILVFHEGAEPVGCCLISEGHPNPFVPIKRLSLNAAGEPAQDTTYVEFNDIVCKPGYETRVAESLAKYLRDRDWDEVSFDGFVHSAALNRISRLFSNLDYQRTRHPSYYVDLKGIREAGITYEGALKSSMRKRLRQNNRYHADIGPLRLTTAQSIPEALAMLDELAELSRERWSALGQRGIFSSARFVEFHRRLITRCLPEKTVQLIRVTAGPQLLGLIYNVIDRGTVYFYQCGYKYTDDKRLSPGSVTLGQAIEHCLAAGYDCFEFLSGDAKYKEWMSTGSRDLTWILIRRTGLKLRLIDGLRRAKRHLESVGVAAE